MPTRSPRRTTQAPPPATSPTPTTPPTLDELDALRARVEALQTEERGLAKAEDDAITAVAVEAWMKIQGRKRDLPGEIVAARLGLIPPQLEYAWHSVEEFLRIERDAEVEMQRTQRVLTQMSKPENVYAERTPVQAAELQLQLAHAREAAGIAERAWRVAQNDTAAELFEVDDLETQYQALAGEPAPEGPGIRQRPRPLRSTVVVGERQFLDDGTHLPAPIDFNDYGATTLAAGTVLSRWLAHLVGAPHLFAPDAEVTVASR